MTHESGTSQYNQANPVADQIEYISTLTDEQRRDLWLDPGFTGAFPSIVEELASDQGLTRYPVEVRSQLFTAALSALQTLPLRTRRASLSKSGSAPASEASYIHASGINYDIEQRKIDPNPYARQVRPDATEDLFRMNLAGIIVIGMGLPDRQTAMEQIMSIYRAERRNIKIRDALGLLLPMNSIARKWVKQNGLDSAAGQDWDKVVARMILGLPEHIISEETNQPKSLPNELTFPALASVYSIAVIDEFLEYAQDYAYAMRNRMYAKRQRDLVTFTLAVRSVPALIAQKDVRDRLIIILAAANLKDPTLEQ